MFAGAIGAVGAVGVCASAWCIIALSLGRPTILGSPERIVGSPQRRRLLDLIRAEPGVSVGELKRRAGMSWGPFYHHILILQRAGLVAVRKAGRRTVFLAAESRADEMHVRAVALLKGSSVHAIATYISRHPGASMADVIGASALTPRGAYYHVRRLLEAGLVTSHSRTRHMDLRPTSTLDAALDSLDPRPGTEIEIHE